VSSWLFTALFAVLMVGATVLMLAILVGLCMDGAKGVGYDRTGWRRRLRPFGRLDVTGRTPRLNS
jgi:hypothetical protein